MADKQQKQAPENENRRDPTAEAARMPGSGVGPVQAVVIGAAMTVAKLWNALTRDGTLAAAFRQGADEIGAALKAFPDSIQASEHGTILNPTQGEIAKGRERGTQGHHAAGRAPWPSEIAEANRIAPPDIGQDQGRDAGYSL